MRLDTVFCTIMTCWRRCQSMFNDKFRRSKCFSWKKKSYLLQTVMGILNIWLCQYPGCMDLKLVSLSEMKNKCWHGRGEWVLNTLLDHLLFIFVTSADLQQIHTNISMFLIFGTYLKLHKFLFLLLFLISKYYLPRETLRQTQQSMVSSKVSEKTVVQ